MYPQLGMAMRSVCHQLRDRSRARGSYLGQEGCGADPLHLVHAALCGEERLHHQGQPGARELGHGAGKEATLGRAGASGLPRARPTPMWAWGHFRLPACTVCALQPVSPPPAAGPCTSSASRHAPPSPPGLETTAAPTHLLLMLGPLPGATGGPRMVPEQYLAC